MAHGVRACLGKPFAGSILPVGPRERGVRGRGDRSSSSTRSWALPVRGGGRRRSPVGRVVVGAHYPADVLAGMLVGAARQSSSVRLGRPVILAFVRPAERITDPLVMLLRRLALTRAR